MEMKWAIFHRKATREQAAVGRSWSDPKARLGSLRPVYRTRGRRNTEASERPGL